MGASRSGSADSPAIPVLEKKRFASATSSPAFKLPSTGWDVARRFGLSGFSASTTLERPSAKHLFSEPCRSCLGGSLNQHVTAGGRTGFSEPQANAVSLDFEGYCDLVTEEPARRQLRFTIYSSAPSGQRVSSHSNCSEERSGESRASVTRNGCPSSGL